jgi:predicted RNA-binding protein (virulence factor B family)
MIEIGKYHTLEVAKVLDFGVYLDAGDAGLILLPIRYAPENCEPGDSLNVFVYLDNEERLIATTQKPYAQVGDFAALEVLSIEYQGAFLDWGLMKNVLLPFREQRTPVKQGDKVVVYIYIDEKSDRITASTKVEKFAVKGMPDLYENQGVEVLIYEQTKLGYKTIVNNKYLGLIYGNEVFRPIQLGMKTTAYIKQIRSDFKIDLVLEKPGPGKITDFTSVILDKLQQSHGFLPFTDKTAAGEIYESLSMSKKNFKKAVGSLYRQRIIDIDDAGIQLKKKDSTDS